MFRPDDLYVRDATVEDLAAIVDIYNQSIPGGWSTADTVPITVEDRTAWFERFSPDKRPLWVGEIDRQIVAWIALNSFYEGRPAYNATAEVSLYVATSYQRRGIGLYLKQRMINACPFLGITTLISMHFDHNEATRRLNASLGFKAVGHLPGIAIVKGEKRGLVISMLKIGSHAEVSEIGGQ